MLPGPITLFNGTRQPAGYQFHIEGTPNAPYAIEGTADLQTWQLLTVGVTHAGGVLELLDPAATGALRRFYQAVR